MTVDKNEMIKEARIDAIMAAASTAVFYQMGSLTLRIQSAVQGEKKFSCLDEDTGEQYYVEADSVEDDHVFIVPRSIKVASIVALLNASIETTLALGAAKST